MAYEQCMTQGITLAVIEAAKAVIMAAREIEGPTESRRPVHVSKRAR